MSPKPNAVYTIHFIPKAVKPPIIGGVFITSPQTLSKPLLAEPNTPPFFKSQQVEIPVYAQCCLSNLPFLFQWRLVPVPDKEGEWQFTEPELQHPPQGPGGITHGPVFIAGWGIREQQIKPNERLILSTNLVSWILIDVEPVAGDPNAFTAM